MRSRVRRDRVGVAGGAGPDAGGAASASLPGKPVYGKDAGLWSTWWAAELLGP